MCANIASTHINPILDLLNLKACKVRLVLAHLTP